MELHCHSGFSFLDGASHPEELILRAEELGYRALALTDHNGLYGSMEFAQRARAHGIQPVTGAEVTVAGCFPGRDDPVAPRTGAPELEDPFRSGHHLTLLAESPEGYANLCRLLTEAHMEAPERGRPRLDLASLLARTEGLVCLTGCRRSPLLDALGSSVADGEAFAGRLLDAFGPGGLFVELQHNRARGDARRTKSLARLADRLGIPVVATGNVHYHRRSRHRLQDVLVAVRNRATLDGSHEARRPNACHHLASPAEVARRFRSRPDALRATLAIAERCASFDLTEDLGYTFPDFEGSGNGKSALQILAETCRSRLEERYPGPGVGSAPGGRRKTREKRAEAERRLREELA
ncbi:MAG TPA: PHP domain-containing protein, partial [Longimicrobiales bacterium]|nr:PHP domain-containing protein [Longimicrobiales bacterium]